MGHKLIPTKFSREVRVLIWKEEDLETWRGGVLLAETKLMILNPWPPGSSWWKQCIPKV